MCAAATGRRQFLGGLLAAGLAPRPTWADAGSPTFLSAAATSDGRYLLCGIGADLTIRFRRPLPDRGHAAAAHPTRPEAVAFARRPGTFAIVIDCMTGTERAILTAPEGRHFYGHGVFSEDGSLLFTTENDYEAGRGRIGIWDANAGYARLDEWDSGGIGPHDIKRLPGSDVLVVANGGIDTHPETGRTKLNIPTMAPNLAYIADGALLETAQLAPDLHKNSIRHLALDAQGTVAFGMQWQGDGVVSALVGTHRQGAPMTLMEAPQPDIRNMEGYIGSIAMGADGRTIAVTSPRGGLLHLYDAASKQLIKAEALADICGVATLGPAFAVTSGTGALRQTDGQQTIGSRQANLQWDNHLIPIATP
ncbi:DUF1513 domain-containing protein [Yoonia sp. BS5-3]|uniref:DUF1513 domain-containing protein n=1 Tax=Yoonia phaeophyticola TaxID=3137369 RepID=A0ABZ2V0I4_9RHOB